MKEKQPLLDYLAEKIGTRCISDVRYNILWGAREENEALLQALADLAVEAYPLEEWNRTLTYLTKQPPRETGRAAKESLCAALAGENEKT